jgi:ketosteroid isomerase-like protein
MASENADIYRRSLEAFNRRDKEAWRANIDPALENHPPSEWPEARVLHGADAVWDFFVEGFEPWESTGLEIVGPIEESDDAVMVHVQAEIQGKASGAELLWEYFHVVWFKEGGIATRMAWFADRDEALAAAGI